MWVHVCIRYCSGLWLLTPCLWMPTIARCCHLFPELQFLSICRWCSPLNLHPHILCKIQINIWRSHLESVLRCPTNTQNSTNLELSLLFYHRIFPTNDPMLGNYIIYCSGWESGNEVQLSLSSLTIFPSPSSHASCSLLPPLNYFLNLSFSILIVILSCKL